MNELYVALDYALIGLNAQDTGRLTNAKRAALRCMAAAGLLELLLNKYVVKENDAIVLEKPNQSIMMYQESILQVFLGKKLRTCCTLQEMLLKVTRFSKNDLKTIEHAFANTMKERGILEEVPSLLSCDLYYETAGITVTEYRANPGRYTEVTESLRAEILENGQVTDEAVILFWLLKESGCLYDLFSKEELKRVAERFDALQDNHQLARQLFSVDIHKTKENFIRGLMDLKKRTVSTQVGSGSNFIFPFVQRSEAVFIETEAYFSGKEERLRDIQARLDWHKITYKIIYKQDVPLIKVGNDLYEAVPYAKQMRVPVHGVQLRKYPVSI